MQVLKQCVLKNTPLRFKYIEEIFKKVKLLKQEILKPFYRGEMPN